MKMRTRLVAWGTALVMATTTILSTGIQAFASGLISAQDLGGPIHTSKNWQSFDYMQPAFRISVAPDTTYLHDADKDSNYFSVLENRVGKYKNGLYLKEDLPAETRTWSSSVWVFPTVDPTIEYDESLDLATKCSGYMNYYGNSYSAVFVKTVGSDGNITFFKTDSDSSSEASSYYIGDEDLEETNVITSNELESIPMLEAIFSDIEPITNAGRTFDFSSILSNYKDYRASLKFNADLEYADILKLLSCLRDDKRATLEKRVSDLHEAHKPITLVIEPYYPVYNANTLCMMYFKHDDLLNIARAENYVLAPTTNHSYDSFKQNGTVAIDSCTSGFYYLISSNGTRNSAVPAYNSKYSLDDATNKAIKKDAGWIYFSLCTNDNTAETQIAMTKKYDVISSDGSASAADINMQKFSLPYTASVDMIISDPVSLTDLKKILGSSATSVKDAKSLATALSKTVSLADALSALDWVKSVRDTMNTKFADKGLSANLRWDNHQTTGGGTSTIGNTFVFDDKTMKFDKKETYFYFVCEYGISVPDSPTCEVEVTTKNGGAILCYQPSKKSDNWSIYSFSDLRDDLAPIAITSNNGAKVTVAVTNTADITVTKEDGGTPDPINVPTLTAEAVVVDVDNYYVTDYPAEYCMENNEQLVYTKSAIETKDNNYQVAYSMDTAVDTIASQMSELLEHITTDVDDKVSDPTILQSPIKDAKYTKIEKYDYYVNMINPQSDKTKHTFKVNKDYVKDYAIVLDKNLHSVSDIPTVSNYEYSDYKTLTTLEMDGWGTLTSSDLLAADSTHTFEVKNAKDLSASQVEANLTKYTEYCRDYAIYEAMVGASANSMAEAMKYWTKATYLIYSDLVDLRNTTLKDPSVSTGSAKCGTRHVRRGSRRYGYYYVNCSHSHTTYSATSISNNRTACANQASDIQSKIDKLADKLHDITGWKLAYTIRYRDYTTTNCGKSCCSSSDYKSYKEITKTKTGKYGSATASGNSLGIWFKISSTDGPNQVEFSKMPDAIADISTYLNNIADTGTKTTKLGGLMGNLTHILAEQLAASAKLENERPNAEFRISQRYELKYDSNYFSEAGVPVYMMSYYWKDPNAFVNKAVTGGLLATILDFEGRALGTSSTTAGGTKEVDAYSGTSPVFTVLQRFNKVAAADQRKYTIVDEKGKQTEYIRPVYLWAYSDTPSVVGDALVKKMTVKISGDNNTAGTTSPTYSKAKRYRLSGGIATPFGETLITNFDALSYAYPSMGIWTSIWRVESTDEVTPNSSNLAIPNKEWLNAWNVGTVPKEYTNTVLLANTADKKNDYIVCLSDIISTGANTVSGKDFALITAPGIADNDAKKVTTKEIQDSIISPDIAEDYYYVKTDGKVHVDTVQVTDKAQSMWYVSSTPYELTAKFSRYYSPEKALEKTFGDKGASEIELDETPDGTALGHGSYTRDSEIFSIYPFVKMAYYEPTVTASTVANALKYTYVAGQTKRQMFSNVYYKMGIMGSAQPTVAANAYASSEAALALSKSGKYNGGVGTPVTYTGSGLTVSYAPDNLSIALQTFNLRNTDAEKGYQARWGNTTNTLSAHDEVLNALGAKGVTVNTDVGSSTVTGIPYIAGCQLDLTNGSDIKSEAWIMSQDKANMMLECNTPATTAGQIKLIVAKGELIQVIIPNELKIANIIDDEDKVGTAMGGADQTYVATGTFSGTSTAATLNALRKGGAKLVAEALRGVGITGSEDDVLHKTFAYNEGSTVTADYNGNVAKELRHTPTDADSKWYNEYVNCLVLEYECTTYQVQPITFTDKMPIEMGPTTPADQSKYFSEGYGLVASYLMLKVGDPTADAGDLTGIGTLVNNTWLVPRNKTADGSATVTTGSMADVIVSNVPVTAAN